MPMVQTHGGVWRACQASPGVQCRDKTPFTEGDRSGVSRGDRRLLREQKVKRTLTEEAADTKAWGPHGIKQNLRVRSKVRES